MKMNEIIKLKNKLSQMRKDHYAAEQELRTTIKRKEEMIFRKAISMNTKR
jgi:hypothetical protein